MVRRLIRAAFPFLCAAAGCYRGDAQEAADAGSEADSGTSSAGDSDGEATSAGASGTDTDAPGADVDWQPVYRINVGGPELGEFTADPEQAPLPMLASPGTLTFAVAEPIERTDEVPAGVPEELFATGRVEPDETAGGTGQIRYVFPMQPGRVRVELHLVETDPDVAVGDRVFDVYVEGERVAENIDVLDRVGLHRAMTLGLESETDDELEVELVRKPWHAMPMLAGITVSSEAAAQPPTHPAGAVFYVAPEAEGAGDGSSYDNAAPLSALTDLVSAAQPGDEIWLRPGTYTADSSIGLSGRGTADAPIVIRGAGRTWLEPGRPLLVGSRSDPWSPEGADGNVLFRLEQGSEHLRFVNLGFENIGWGVFVAASDIHGLTIENMVARNVRQFFENAASDATATVTGFVLKDVDVRGFSKGVVELLYDSSDALIEDVYGDSERQHNDPFCMGSKIEGTAHAITHRRAVMLNCHQTNGDEYWNADGFVANAGTYDLTFEDTYAAGHTDGGYDLKSENTVMISPYAGDNKRNYRLWRDTLLTQCVSENPLKRGGNGTQAHLHAQQGGDVTMVDCSFTDLESPDTIVFDIDEGGRATIQGGRVEMRSGAQLQTIEGDPSLLELIDVEVVEHP